MQTTNFMKGLRITEEEGVITYLKILSWHFPGDMNEIYEKSINASKLLHYHNTR